MAQEEKVTFNVTKGPSKADLQTALFHGATEQQIRITFMLKATEETVAKRHLSDDLRLATRFVEARLLGVEREDGSGESWILKGYLTFKGGQPDKDQTVAFTGYYTSKHRTGYFTATFERSA